MKYLKNCFVSIENITVRERMEACCLRLLSTIKFNFLVCRKGDGRLAAKPPFFCHLQQFTAPQCACLLGVRTAEDVIALREIVDSPVIIGGSIVRFEEDGLIIVLDRLRHLPQSIVSETPVVVSFGVR